jgi:hypothetical protein
VKVGKHNGGWTGVAPSIGKESERTAWWRSAEMRWRSTDRC